MNNLTPQTRKKNVSFSLDDSVLPNKISDKNKMNFGGTNFGQTSTSVFGATNPTPSSTFGTTPAATSAFGTNKVSAFGGTNFGQTSTSVFGATNPTPSSTFGTTPAATSAFGTSKIPAFGGTNFGQTLASGFGTINPTPSTFGTTPAATSAFGTSKIPAFGGTNFGQTSTSSFGASATQQSNLVQEIVKDITLESNVIFDPQYAPSRDARDRVTSMLNKMLAACGVGKGYYKPGQEPYTFTNHNHFFRLKGIGYNRLSRHKDSEGLVSLILNTPASQIKSTERTKIMDEVNQLLRAKPPTTAFGSQQQQQSDPILYTEFHGAIPLGDNRTDFTISVSDGLRRKLTATELYLLLNKDDKLNALKTKIQCEKVVAKVEVTEEDKKRYVQRIPPGFGNEWFVAVENNPDPINLLPFPIYGFEELTQRQKLQQSTIALQADVLRDFKERLSTLNNQVINSNIRYTRCKENQKRLSHRLLRVLCCQMMLQRYNMPIDQNEEQLQVSLERLNANLLAPDRLKARLIAILKFLETNEELLKKLFKEQKPKLPLTRDDLMALKRCFAHRHDSLEYLYKAIRNAENTLNIINNTRK